MSAPVLDLPEDAYISHFSKGRLRLRIPSKKRDKAFWGRLQATLSGLKGMEQVRINPVSGSLLLLYHNPVEIPERIKALGKKSFHYRRKESFSAKDNSITRTMTGTFHRLNTRIRRFTKGELDVSTLSFLALTGVGIYQISRKNITAPAWHTAFWYALNIFLLKNGERKGKELT